ncbi:MAG: flagellar hook-length control protein FliK [Gemmatimonadetes bacterium]|nr:flagellar hook-length control protein FliK [Gemmatimonadota bacterium]
MTAAIGSALPLQSAPAQGEGDVVDPAAAQPFLAALAAAVAAPIAPPKPLLVAVVATEQADAEGVVDGEASGESGDDARVDDAAPTRPPASEADASQTKGTLLRVLVAERAAPDASAVRSVPPSAVSGGDASTDKAAEGDASSSHDKALGHGDRAEHALVLPVAAESPAATPSLTMWQAAVQAQAAPARAADSDHAPALDAPPAAPFRTPATGSGEAGRPPANATSVAAGVLAAMHAAHVAQADDARASAPMVEFAEQVVATLTLQGGVSPGVEQAGADMPAGAAKAMVDAGDSAPLPTPQRVLVTARPATTQGEHDATSDGRHDAPGEERHAVAAPPLEGVEAPMTMARAPWPGGETSTPTKVIDTARPTAEVHRTMEPPATPPTPTSQVTVELDAERTGVQRVRVAVRGDVVHATLVTDRGGVEAMRPQLDDLRHALEGQGFREAHVQVRMAGDGTPAAVGGATAELRLRNDAPSRAPDGSSSEQQPRGRQRGQDQHPPAGGQPDFEEEIL